MRVMRHQTFYGRDSRVRADSLCYQFLSTITWFWVKPPALCTPVFSASLYPGGWRRRLPLINPGLRFMFI